MSDISLDILDYDFDEERHGFEEPFAQPGPAMPLGQRLSIVAIVLGVVFLGLVAFAGLLGGSWAGVLLSFGVIFAGIAGAGWFHYRGTTPGIKHDGTTFSATKARGWIGWILAILITAFYVVLYWYEPLQDKGMAPVLDPFIDVLDPMSVAMTGAAAGKWFLYGVLYTGLIIVFGIRMIMKYRHNRYQIIRTLSVMFFQTAFAWWLPNLLIKFQQPYLEFNGVWPLKYDYLWPGKIDSFQAAGGFGMFLMGWALMLTFIATPVLTYFYGKRWYCSWVCGCGGLAETLGDPWRQLSDKSTRAWRVERWMIHAVLVFVVVATAVIWINSLSKGATLGAAAVWMNRWYGFLIGAAFSGVIGVGFYPIMGSRVWCRFGCPMAAILGIIQRFFSRFRITVNGDQCMSCGNCSTFCEMGIDVRAYAEKGENIVRASCVGCGVCAAVCPRGVLKLENGSTHGDRYTGSDQPLNSLVSALRDGPRVP